MEEMKIDFEIEEDPVKLFLLRKLEYIKLKNLELEQQIQRRKELLNECLTKMTPDFSENVLKITETWQRILNGKWIVGIEVKNINTSRVAKDLEIILKWNSVAPLTYNTAIFHRNKPEPKEFLPEEVKAFLSQFEIKKNVKRSDPLENEWVKTDKVQDCATILLRFDVPEFIENTQYKISGFLKYQMDNTSCQLDIPNFEIKAHDLTNTQYAIKITTLLSGEEKAFLSNLVANKLTKLVTRISPKAYTSLDKMLEFECKFRKIEVISRTTFFFVSGIVDSIDGCLLEIDQETNNIYNLNIFSRDHVALHLLLHYLHQNIPEILILPIEYKENLLEEPLLEIFENQGQDTQDPALKDKLKEFGNAMDQQIILVEKFCLNRIEETSQNPIDLSDKIDLNVESYRNFRKELADLELKADLQFVTVDQLTVKSDAVSDSSQD